LDILDTSAAIVTKIGSIGGTVASRSNQ